MKKNKLHPTQPLELDKHDVSRFRENAIVVYMLDAGKRGAKFDLNTLACMDFSDEDRMQLAQLIGYSLSGYGDLSYVSDKSYYKAANSKSYAKILKKLAKKESKNGTKD